MRTARNAMMLVMIGKAEKRCAKCKALKPLKEFRRQAGRPGNRQARCRMCARAYEREHHGKRSRPYRQRRSAKQLAAAEKVRKLLAQRAKAVAV
jgi:hypothetical protein